MTYYEDFVNFSTDLDECAAAPTLCEQVCNNTVGSYECSCVQGYQLVAGTSQCEGVHTALTT